MLIRLLQSYHVIVYTAGYVTGEEESAFTLGRACDPYELLFQSGSVLVEDTRVEGSDEESGQVHLSEKPRPRKMKMHNGIRKSRALQAIATKERVKLPHVDASNVPSRDKKK